MSVDTCLPYEDSFVQHFSSESVAWKASITALPVDAIVPNSGISTAGEAYWQTFTPSILSYGLATDKARVVPLPPRCAEAGALCQLGEAGGDAGLCCTCVTMAEVAVFAI
ncbi:hypothetical protein ZIOFF_069035 [Zingiber officinale]|uniref:Uncharacterized protein n=1 Tax=Zingiber officinale TaxID=94328 RepID=A0A8J5EU13_ZINOF|nr:hypothetical protein ZIOFF_069035 [Zingiber officinale]